MSGNKAGGKAAAKSNIERHGKDFYARIGAIGGRKSRGGGFADRDLARAAGAKGGSISRRRKAPIADTSQPAIQAQQTSTQTDFDLAA